MEEPASDGREASCDGEEHCEADEDRLPGGELYILLHLRRLTMGEGDWDIYPASVENYQIRTDVYIVYDDKEILNGETSLAI